MVEQIEHNKVVVAASGEQSEIKLCPYVGHIIIEILDKLRDVPTEDL